jgi:hypothetical protein
MMIRLISLLVQAHAYRESRRSQFQNLYITRYCSTSTVRVLNSTLEVVNLTSRVLVLEYSEYYETNHWRNVPCTLYLVLVLCIIIFTVN